MLTRVVQWRMKRDGRTLDHKTLEEIRLMAVQRVREGESAAAVIASYGFSRTTIYKWLKASSGRGRGLKALRGTRGSGRPRKLTAAQERQVFRWINGRDPRQYGLDFGLWTRAIVVTLIEQKFGVRLGVTAVGTLLAKLGLTPQKPLQRAYQRDGAAIERWQRETYPGIAQQAKQQDADIFFWDESGFRADTVHGKTWGPRGQTPVVHRPGRRQLRQAHRHGPQTPAGRREAGDPNRRRTRGSQTQSQARALILRGADCRLYFRLLSNP